MPALKPSWINSTCLQLPRRALQEFPHVHFHAGRASEANWCAPGATGKYRDSQLTTFLPRPALFLQLDRVPQSSGRGLDCGFRRSDERLGAMNRAPTQETCPYEGRGLDCGFRRNDEAGMTGGGRGVGAGTVLVLVEGVFVEEGLEGGLCLGR